ncbi:hypothetical protein ACFWWT_44895 [Streptomyces sp. NPDC058676]|uniref:hypothetical protein n=1 Tax=unclassified Streptomyces TaxID=2593676 RepID=UPI00365256AE
MDLRQRERAGLLLLEAYETVLPRTHPNTTQRRMLEALGEAGGLCTARTMELSTDDATLCTREAGHYDDKPSRKDGKPAGTSPMRRSGTTQPRTHARTQSSE